MNASRYKFPISAPHRSRLLRLPRNITSLRFLRETTPEHCVCVGLLYPTFLNTLYSLMDFGIIPFAIFIFRVKLHGLHVVSGDETSKHVSLGSPDLSDLSLLDCSCKDFILLDKVSEPMPSF